jgi:hypothetical protein
MHSPLPVRFPAIHKKYSKFLTFGAVAAAALFLHPPDHALVDVLAFNPGSGGCARRTDGFFRPGVSV